MTLNPIPKEVKDLLTRTPEQVNLKAHSRLHYPENGYDDDNYNEPTLDRENDEPLS